MNYAVIDEGVVTNLIFMYPGSMEDFPNAVLVDDRPVMIGDTYADGRFYRDGQLVLSDEEHIELPSKGGGA